MIEQQNIEALRRAYEAFGRGDMNTVLGVFDDNVEWFSPGPADLPTSGMRRGRQEVAEFFRALDEVLEYELFEPKKFIANGDDVVVLGEETFRIRATGKRLTCEWAQVCEMKGGKVTRFHEYIEHRRRGNPEGEGQGLNRSRFLNSIVMASFTLFALFGLS